MAAVFNYGYTAKFIFTFSSLALMVVFLGLMASRLPTGFLEEKPEAKMGSGALTSAASNVPAGKTIVLKNENDIIVGQMARISSPSAPIADVHSMSASGVDKRKGRELLSIINQY